LVNKCKVLIIFFHLNATAHTPPDASPLASSTSSLAASIAASFFIKASTNAQNSEITPPHGRESPSIPRDSASHSKRDSPPAHKLMDVTEDILHHSAARPQNKRYEPNFLLFIRVYLYLFFGISRGMNRNNSTIGVSTLRGMRRLLEKDKEVDKDREKEKEKERSLQLHKMVSEQRLNDVQQLLADHTVARYSRSMKL
jgi:hypothetical protein